MPNPEILPKLYKYCAYQDRCRFDIEKKLKEWEVADSEWEKLILHLEEERFLDEKRFVRSFVRGKFFHKKWGRHKIRLALKQKKIDPALIDTIFEEEIDAESYEKTLRHLIEKKSKEWRHLSSKDQEIKITRFLNQKGYEWELIRQQVRLFLSMSLLLLMLLVSCQGPAKKLPLHASLNPNTNYVGIEACKNCHNAIYQSFIKSGMGQSLYRPAFNETIERFGPNEVVHDPQRNYHYQAFWEGDQMFIREFRIAGKDTLFERREAVDYVVGSGHQTRSYLFEKKQHWYEMPITWYVEKQIWDLSPGYEQNNARFDREIGLECLSCHTGKVHFVKGSKNKFEHVALGIDCEKCHGPGQAHVDLMMAGDYSEEALRLSIVQPDELEMDRQFDICQQCHLQGINVYHDSLSMADFRPGMALSSVADIFIEKPEDENAFGIASHAQRLKASLCFQQSNGQLNCTSCHDPHKGLDRADPTWYIRQCQNCHQTDSVGICLAPEKMQVQHNGNCISCHMPAGGTRDIPHVRFHDHKIRIVRTDSQDIDTKAIKDFLRLQYAGSEQARDGSWAEAWLQYFERIDPDHQWLAQAEKHLKDSPNYSRARIYFYQGKYDEALEVLEVESNSHRPLIHYLKGEILEALGEYEMARTAFEKAYHLNSNSWEAGFKSAVMLLKAQPGQQAALDSASVRFESLHEQKPFDVRILANLGFVRLNQGRFQEAEALVRKALDYDPDYEAAQKSLNYILEHRK